MWISKEDKFNDALNRLNRLSKEIIMTQDQYDFLYKEILSEFDNITK